MRTIIAGSRTIFDYNVIQQAIQQSGFDITQIVSGMAKGVDSLAVDYAKNNGISLASFPAKWIVDGVYRPQAGYLRNLEMSEHADALIAIWDGKSPGTKHMVDIAIKRGLAVYVFRLDQEG